MESKVRAAASLRRQRRRKTIILTTAVVVVVIALLIYEQVALLYVLSTLSLATLLIVVAWSDLSGTRRPASEPPLDDSAAVGSGISAATRTKGAQAARAGRGRR